MRKERCLGAGREQCGWAHIAFVTHCIQAPKITELNVAEIQRSAVRAYLAWNSLKSSTLDSHIFAQRKFWQKMSQTNRKPPSASRTVIWVLDEGENEPRQGMNPGAFLALFTEPDPAAKNITLYVAEKGDVFLGDKLKSSSLGRRDLTQWEVPQISSTSSARSNTPGTKLCLWLIATMRTVICAITNAGLVSFTVLCSCMPCTSGPVCST